MAVGIEHVLVGGEHAEKATANLGSMTSSLDATLPPTPLRNLLAADGAGVFVLSPDADLQSVVQQAGGEQFPVYSASDWRQLIEAIESGRCGIVLLDVAAVAPRLEKRLAELDRYADRLVILVAAERDDADGLIALLSERRIHRLLIKPAALGITRLLLESAVSRWFEMREARRESNAAATAPAWHPNQLGRHWLVVTLIAAGIIAAASIAVKSLNPSGGTDGASPALAGGSAPSAAADARASDPFARLLQAAEQAWTDGKLSEPPGDNALDYYLAILAVDPTHAVAINGLDRVVESLYTQAEEALLAESADRAAAALGAIRRARPESLRLAFLEAQLERLRLASASDASSGASRADAPASLAAAAGGAAAATSADATPATSADATAAQASNTTVAPRPTELDSLITLSRLRLQRDQVIEPAGDSALEYLRRAVALAPRDARVSALRTQVATRVVASARDRLQAGDWKSAELLVDQAVGLETDATVISELQQGLADLWIGVARERLRSGALVAPEDDSAFFYLDRLRQRFPDSPDAITVGAQLELGLLDYATRAMATSDFEGASAWLDWAERAVGGASTAVADLRSEVTFRKRQAEFLAEPAPASEMYLLSFEPPRYPERALADGIEGWVDLHLVVDRDGRPRSVEVVAAEPRDRFELAAIEAVSRYRYQPFVLEGRTYERLLRLRVRFEIN